MHLQKFVVGVACCALAVLTAWPRIGTGDFGSLRLQVAILIGAIGVGLCWVATETPRRRWAERASRVLSHRSAGGTTIPTETIGTLQALRGFAALSVAFYHTDMRLPGGLHVDFQGVSIFFVISGFIMTYISRADTADFVRKRLIRIVPVYWFATFFTLFWAYSGLMNLPVMVPALVNWAIHDPFHILLWLKATLVSIGRPENLAQLVQSLFFIPAQQLPVIGVGWTLNIEMFFYLVFALMLTFSRRAAPLLTCAVLWLMLHLNRETQCGVICSTYGHDYVRFFIYGVACYYVWWAIKYPLALFPRLTRLVCSAILVGWIAVRLQGNATHFQHVWVPPVVVLATLGLHSAGVSCGRVLLAIGAASYALYLMHPIVIETIRPLGPYWPAITVNTPLGTALVLVASTIVALGVHYYFEIPVTRYLRRGGLGASASAARANIKALRQWTAQVPEALRQGTAQASEALRQWAAQASEPPRQGAAQASEAPRQGTAQASEAPRQGTAQASEAPRQGTAQAFARRIPNFLELIGTPSRTRWFLAGYASMAIVTLVFQVGVRSGCGLAGSCVLTYAKALVWSAAWPAAWAAYLSGTHYPRDIADYIANEWRAVSHAPVTFAVATLLLSAFAIIALRRSYVRTIRSLKQQLKLTKASVAEYERMLGPAKPRPQERRSGLAVQSSPQPSGTGAYARGR